MDVLIGLGIAVAGALAAREWLRREAERTQPTPQPVPVRARNKRRPGRDQR